MRLWRVCERPKSLVLEPEDASLCSSLLFNVFMSALPLFDTCKKHLTELELYVADQEEIWVSQKSASLAVCLAGAEADVVGSFVEVSCEAERCCKFLLPDAVCPTRDFPLVSGAGQELSWAASAQEQPQERPQPGSRAGQDHFRVRAASLLRAALLSSGHVKCFSSAIRKKLLCGTFTS